MAPISIPFAGNDEEFHKFSSHFPRDAFERTDPDPDKICVVFHSSTRAKFEPSPLAYRTTPHLCFLHVWLESAGKLIDIPGSDQRHMRVSVTSLEALGSTTSPHTDYDLERNKKHLIDACTQTLKDHLMALQLVQLCKQLKKKHPPQEPEDLIGQLLGGGVDLSDVPGDVDMYTPEPSKLLEQISSHASKLKIEMTKLNN